MTVINPGIIAILAASQAAQRRRNESRPRERVEISRVTCLEQANPMLQSIQGERALNITQLVERTRAKRQAFNRWLPRWFQFSLEDGVILEACVEDVHRIYQVDHRVASACARLVDACHASTLDTVSVTRDDWTAMQAAYARIACMFA